MISDHEAQTDSDYLGGYAPGRRDGALRAVGLRWKTGHRSSRGVSLALCAARGRMPCGQRGFSSLTDSMGGGGSVGYSFIPGVANTFFRVAIKEVG